MSYIDTSVIVAALDPLDPKFKRARDFLEKEGGIISELVLAELASVVARREEVVSDLASKLGLSSEETIIAILLYILKRFNLKYKSVDSQARLPLIGKIYKPIAKAIELSSRIKLRTLDLLHIAYAKLIKDKGEHIQRLVTAEKDFERAQEILKEEIGIGLYVIQ